jgi:hypothetical protein
MEHGPFQAIAFRGDLQDQRFPAQTAVQIPVHIHGPGTEVAGLFQRKDPGYIEKIQAGPAVFPHSQGTEAEFAVPLAIFQAAGKPPVGNDIAFSGQIGHG